MKTQDLTILVALALSTGFTACDSSTPGNQAGYALDGTNTCSRQIGEDYNQIQADMGKIESDNQNISSMNNPEQQAAAIPPMEAEIKNARDEISSFKATYNGVVCSADLSDNPNGTITSTSFDNDLSELDQTQANLDSLGDEGHHHGDPTGISGQPTLECNPQMVQEHDQIQADYNSLLETYKALPTDNTQRIQALTALQNSIERTEAELSDYNTHYTGMTCASDSSGESISLITQQIQQLETKVQNNINKLQPVRDHIE